jgi:ABC-type transport system substrate-binding protein
LRRVGAVVAATIAVSSVSASATSAAKPTVKTGGTAKVAIFDTFSGWCFGNNLANSALMAARSVYETLFEKGTDGKLYPLLAESATASSDLKTWTLKIRKRADGSFIKFHDGSDFNAQAVVDNFTYITGQAHFNALLAEAGRITPAITASGLTGSPSSGSVTTKQKAAFTKAYGKAIAAGKSASDAGKSALLSAAGAAENVSKLAYVLSTGAAFSTNILSASVKSGTTDEVVFKLQRAQNDLPATLFASGRFFMRAPSQFNIAEGGNANECATNPIGTGPFMLEEKNDWTTNKLTVIKNTSYWQKDGAGNQLPYLDKIEFNNIKEAPQRAAAIRTGAYDAGMFSSAGEGSNILQLRRAKTKELRSGVEYYPSLWFNQGRPGSPFANADARKAVSHCIDRAAFNRVRQSGQGRVARSLVGPSSVMYSNKGLQAFRVSTARKAVADYKRATGKTKLSFTIPSDVSAASQANIKFLKSQWAKCGITAVVKTSESADIIAKAFNAAPNLARSEFYNAYDAISITLFEGTDVGFNLPFVLTNAFSQGSAAYPVYGSALCVNPTDPVDCGAQLGAKAPYTASALPLNFANMAATRAAVYEGLGTVLGLNHHKDKTIDDCFFTQQAKADVNTVDYGACTQKLIDENVMTSITHFYYTMFFSKRGKLTGYGESKLPGGEARRKISNYGIDWSTVSKG